MSLRQEATDKAAAERTAKADKSALWRTVFRCSAGVAIAVVATVAIAWPLSKHLNAAWVAWTGVAVILAFGWLLYVEHCLSKLPKFKDLRAHKGIKWIRRALGAIIVAVGTSLLAAAIWQSTHNQQNTPAHSRGVGRDRGEERIGGITELGLQPAEVNVSDGVSNAAGLSRTYANASTLNSLHKGSPSGGLRRTLTSPPLSGHRIGDASRRVLTMPRPLEPPLQLSGRPQLRALRTRSTEFRCRTGRLGSTGLSGVAVRGSRRAPSSAGQPPRCPSARSASHCTPAFRARRRPAVDGDSSRRPSSSSTCPSA